ncbi:hypothetical protein [Burkholderia sp. ABCPW 111]|uniref:hypothetical protein n=1 Tax=Burkholderia sp. ABCPW 111 TaxID=1820025 RepID=UPI001269B7D7|nr:hypothetical protein [Burkholderia sp. ABCPW 111]
MSDKRSNGVRHGAAAGSGSAGFPRGMSIGLSNGSPDGSPSVRPHDSPAFAEELPNGSPSRPRSVCLSKSRSARPNAGLAARPPDRPTKTVGPQDPIGEISKTRRERLGRQCDATAPAASTTVRMQL